MNAFDNYDDGGFEMTDPESDFGYNKQEGFSHQILVMLSYKKVIDALSTEMKEGYNELFTDEKGKSIVIYHQDTRETAFQCVLTLKNVMIGDLQGSTQINKITELLNKIEERKKFWLKEQWKWWCSLNAASKQRMNSEGKSVIKFAFNKKLDFDNFFIEDKIMLFREIFEQLELRLNHEGYFRRKSIRAGAE